MKESEKDIYQTRSGVMFGRNAIYPPMDYKELVGGIGITDRDLHETCRLLGRRVTKELLLEKNLTVFLGNGLSCASIELTARQQAMGHTPSPKLLVDMVNMFDFFEDIRDFREMVGRGTVPYVEKAWVQAQKLMEAQQKGEVTFLQCFLGLASVPQEFAGKGILAINVFGPPPQTLNEQLAFLGDGGKLYMTHYERIRPITRSVSSTVVMAEKQGDEVQISRFRVR